MNKSTIIHCTKMDVNLKLGNSLLYYAHINIYIRVYKVLRVLSASFNHGGGGDFLGRDVPLKNYKIGPSITNFDNK